MPEAQGIYRGEVYEIMGSLAEIKSTLAEMLQYLAGDDDGEEETEQDL